MSLTLVDFTERLVPISDFSQGKAGKIFSDVSDNDTEYIILKNNQPTAVLVSIKEYKDIQNKIAKLERILEEVENIRLLKTAQSRKNDDTSSFEDLVSEEGFSMNEIKELAESVEFE
jgi:prevent-host-death family protein